jgi:DNA-binding MarR family transcriptional regulator
MKSCPSVKYLGGVDSERVDARRRARRPSDFPYRSELLANLSALILLWESPALQGRILAKTGESLDQPAHQTLRHLLAWGPMRPTSLAEVLDTGASHVSKILRRLEGDGLVQRTEDPADRRAVLVSLTPSGETAALGVYALGDRMIAEVLEGWSAADVGKYTALTQRFVADALAAADRMLERGLLPPRDSDGA